MNYALLFGCVLLRSCAATAISPQAEAVCDAIYSIAPSRLAFAPSTPKASLNSPTLTELFLNTTSTYWDAANDADVPACTFFPASSEDVSAAIVALGREPGVPFALKSGGHNWNRGFSSTEGGVLISFRPNLQSTILAPNGKIAKVGPGARWTEVMQELDKSNKCAVGGRSGDVGVGGYTLHGGISYLTAQHGLACDNVVEYELVTANGTMLVVNKNSHPQIFLALRGGGNAFGIVTTFTFKTFDIGEIWGGDRTYGSDQLDNINAAITHFTSSASDARAAITANYIFIAANQTNLITIAYFYDGPTPPTDAFAAFLHIPYLSDTTKTQRYPELLDTQVTSAVGIRTSNAFNSFPNMPSTEMNSFLHWHWKAASSASFLSSRQIYGLELFSMALQPIPSALQRASAAQGPGALALDPNNGDKLWIEYDIGWTKTAGDDTLPQQLKTVVDSALAYQKKTYKGVKPTHYVLGDLSFVPYNPLFMNDAQDTQDVLRSYGQATYGKLRSLHKELDPEGFLTSRQKGWFFDSQAQFASTGLSIS